jgi:hypothetical protein
VKRSCLAQVAIAVAVPIAFIIFWALALNRTSIGIYDVSLDDRTVLFTVVSGRDANCRLIETTETATEVRIGVSCLSAQLLPGTALGYMYNFTVPLATPLGSRAVIDASNGQVLERVCTPPRCTPSPKPS